MARPGFKRWWTPIVPEPFERSTYVLLSSLLLIVLLWQWRPLPQPLWHVEHEVARFALNGLSGLGWLLVLAGTFMISHLDLFGLRQAWQCGRATRAGGTGQPFVIRAFYRVVRHPLMLGFLVAFCATPTMSAGHLLFALVTSGHLVLAVKLLEERDLIALYGDTYRDYQRRVPMPLPWPKRPSPAAGAADSGDP